MNNPRQMHRRIIVAIFCLLGGAAVSVVMAWSCAIWGRIGPPILPLSFEQSRALFAGEFGEGRYFDRSQQPGTRGDLLIITPPPPPESTLDEREAYWIEGSAFESFGYWIASAWDELRGPLPSVSEYRAGWPMHCVRGVEAKFPDRNIQRRRGTFTIKGSLGPFAVQGERRVPYLPVWPGLAVCSVLFGSILWLLLAAPFELRRVRRRCSGLCVNCAYDLRGASHARCPECGAIVVPASRASRAVQRAGPCRPGD